MYSLATDKTKALDKKIPLMMVKYHQRYSLLHERRQKSATLFHQQMIVLFWNNKSLLER